MTLAERMRREVDLLVAAGGSRDAAVATMTRAVFRCAAEQHGLLPVPPGPASVRIAEPLDVEAVGYVYEGLLSASLRRDTGAHYTPRGLAREVVEGALEPLVHDPGPLQTADRGRWRRRPAAEILSLRVADIAMGSGVFLVAAARYLADASGAPIADVIENCLYGVDVDPMAVETARLTLWLLAADPARPLTFLDHRLVAGDSLIGSTWASEQTGPLPAGASGSGPLHWPDTFREVTGFDAVIGNPPFLGGKKISGAHGTAYREHVARTVGRGVKGHADLIAYFALRAHDLLGPGGQTGLIATNTLAQGDTREVGLDQIVAAGVTIRRAVKSRPWPSRSAALEYCAVWTSRAPLAEHAERRLNDEVVPGITAALDATSRVDGAAKRLTANADIAFIGSYVLGMGFVLSPDEASEFRAELVFPYLSGQDVNSRPDCSASRLIIDFGERTEAEARQWPDLWNRVERLVKPQRATKDAKRYPRMVHEWWKYWNPRPRLLRAIAGLANVIVLTLHTKTVMPALVPSGQVFSHGLAVFATDDPAMLALLSSSAHYWWAAGRASSMKADLRYTPSDVFETFARPPLTPRLRALGERLHTYRGDLMRARSAGLTTTYNLVFDQSCHDADIAGLRDIHRLIDTEVLRAYGWDDLVDAGLDHGFHRAGPYPRYTVGPAVRREILDRLLERNQAVG